jgi:hypothetical protein
MTAPIVQKLAVCTTIHPGVLAFVRDWHESLLAQTDGEFSLWIALDGLEPGDVRAAIGDMPDATWVHAQPHESPAAIRQRLLSRAVERCDGIVLVDSDDVLHAHRVRAARAALAGADLTACALRLVDSTGKDLGSRLSLPPGVKPEQALPRYNVFGLSNTAWRTSLLRRCLPIPGEVEIVDWYLATRAWLLGARLHFDHVPAMDYRQHAANMLGAGGAVAPEQVVRDARRAGRHFRLVAAAAPVGSLPGRLGELASVAEDVDCFLARITEDPAILGDYVMALNALHLPPLWWSSVAHPALRRIWSK